MRKTHMHFVIWGDWSHVAVSEKILILKAFIVLSPSQIVLGITGWDLGAKEEVVHKATTV